MGYLRQKRILKKDFKQARKIFEEESIRAEEDEVEQSMEVNLNFLLESYAFKLDIIRLKAKKYEPLTDIEKERRDKRKKRKICQLKRQHKVLFRACRLICGAGNVFQIKEAFFLERKRLHKQRKEAEKALKLEARQSKDNENKASTNLGQVLKLGNISREHII